MLFFTALFSTTSAAECDPTRAFREGAHTERTTTNAKGKPLGTSAVDVLSHEPDGDGFRSHVKITNRDKKGREQVIEADMTCAGGVYRFEGMSAVLPELTEAYRDWTVTVDGAALDYPTDAAPGTRLPDQKLTVTLTMPEAPAGIPATTLALTWTNRTVEAQESHTTPAGSFETTKLRFDLEANARSIVSVTTRSEHVEWFAPGVGVVRSELYRKGKLQSVTELTALR